MTRAWDSWGHTPQAWPRCLKHSHRPGPQACSAACEGAGPGRPLGISQLQSPGPSVLRPAQPSSPQGTPIPGVRKYR